MKCQCKSGTARGTHLHFHNHVITIIIRQAGHCDWSYSQFCPLSEDSNNEAHKYSKVNFMAWNFVALGNRKFACMRFFRAHEYYLFYSILCVCGNASVDFLPVSSRIHFNLNSLGKNMKKKLSIYYRKMPLTSGLMSSPTEYHLNFIAKVRITLLAQKYP